MPRIRALRVREALLEWAREVRLPGVLARWAALVKEKASQRFGI